MAIIGDDIVFTDDAIEITGQVGECGFALSHRGTIHHPLVRQVGGSGYQDRNRIPRGTRVSRQIDVKVTNLDLYPSIMSALVKANISETIQTKLSVSNELEVTDQALVEATADAKARAERLAKSQSKRLGDPYSISEFMTRGGERYTLFVCRRVDGQSTQAVANLP